MSEESAGIIPIYRPTGELLVVQHNAGHWGFPKGHREANETLAETALRELSEEVGISDVELVPDAITQRYEFEKNGNTIQKTVWYFIGYPKSKHVILNGPELKAYAWLSYDEALERLPLALDVLKAMPRPRPVP